MTTENIFNVDRVAFSIKELFDIEAKVEIIGNVNFSKNSLYQITIDDLDYQVRETLGICDEKHKCYRLTENYLFSSASFAASLVAGNNRNGLDVWETKDGYTLKNLGYGSSNDTDEE